MQSGIPAQFSGAASTPHFYFRVTWGSCVMYFSEAAGLDALPRHVESTGSIARLRASVASDAQQYGHLILKKGVFQADAKLWSLLDSVRMNTIERTTITISLLDPAGNAATVWTLSNACPVKIAGTDMKAGVDEVAVESIEIAYDGLTIETR